jgi:MFS family permease
VPVQSLAWFTELSWNEKRTFWACFSGWALDAMDTQIYPLAIPTLMAVWHLTSADAGVLGTTVLIMSAVGGWLAGMLADRMGRVRVLKLTIIWFTTFTLLSGLTTSFWQLLTTRSLQGLGFGGEWAVGAVLISEAINPRVRGRVVGAIQAGWAIGYGLAVLVSMAVFTWLPDAYAWRVLFCAGFVPSLAVLWIVRRVEETRVYVDDVQAAASRADARRLQLWDIFRPPFLGTTLKASLLTTGIYGGNYVMITWLPAFLKLSLHLSVLNAGGYLAVNIFGSFCGAFLNGYLADGIGRRKTFIVCACLQAAAVVVYTMMPITASATFFLGFVLGTLQSGTAAGTGAFLAELFPTRIRATAQGFCGNAGRATGALFPLAVGFLNASRPLGIAMGVCAVAAYGIVVVFAFTLPETRGRELRSITAETATA